MDDQPRAGADLPAPEIGVMTRAELDQVIHWASQEGWVPGEGDAAAYAVADPQGRFAARVEGRMIASLGVVNWGPDYAFGGLFITAPEWRSHGIGGALAQAGLAHAGDRVLGADGVAEQVAYYERLGLRLAHWHVRYATAPGSLTPAPAGEQPGFRVVPGNLDLVGAAVAYDSQFFPGDRREFMTGWLDPRSPWRTWYAAVDATGGVTGLGVIRPAPPGYRVGPLQAQTPQIAAALLDTLAAGRSGPVYLDIPDCNPAAVDLVTARAMSPVFRCARMYRGGIPELPLDRSYGVCTLELG